mgnify:CR=1 FL=1
MKFNNRLNTNYIYPDRRPLELDQVVVGVNDVMVHSNFFVFYDHDQKESKHCLSPETHGAGPLIEDGRWVLIGRVGEAVAASAAAASAAAAAAAEAQAQAEAEAEAAYSAEMEMREPRGFTF